MCIVLLLTITESSNIITLINSINESRNCYMLRDDLLERLERLDEDAYLLYPGEDRYRLVIVGGSAL